MNQQTTEARTLRKKLGILAGDRCIDTSLIIKRSARTNPEGSDVPLYDILEESRSIGMAGNYEYIFKSIFGADIINVGYGTTSVIPVTITRSRTYEALSDGTVKYISRVDNTPPQVKQILTRPEFMYQYGVIADYCKGSVTPELVSSMLESAQTLYVDTKSADISKYAGCIVKLNDIEFEATKSQHHLLKGIVHTRGPNGARLIMRGFKPFEVEGINKDISPVNVSGAGDVFFSYFIALMELLDVPPKEALTLANKAANLSVMRHNTYCPQLTELYDARSKETSRYR